MPVLLGMILGVVLTIAGAFTYDTMTGRAPNGLQASSSTPSPMVNWSVVGENWHNLQTGAHDVAAQIRLEWKKLTS